MVMSEQQVLELKVSKAEGQLAKLKAKLLKAKKVNVKSLKVEDAVLRQVKSGKFAWSGKAVDPKTGIEYTINAVAVTAVFAVETATEKKS